MVRHCTQTLEPNSFIPAKHTGTIDFYHFIPVSVALTLDGGHKVRGKRNWLNSCFHSFQLNGMKSGMVIKQVKFNIPILVLSEIYVIKGINCVLLTTHKKPLWDWHAFRHL